MTEAGAAVDDQERISDEEAVAPAAVDLASSAAAESTSRSSGEGSGLESRAPDLSRLQTAMVSISVGGIRRLVSTGTTVVHHLASSPPARYVGDIAGEISAALAEDSGIDWRRAGDRAEAQMARLFAVVIPVVVDSIDPADIIDRIGVNALIEKVDIDAVLDRVDLDRVLASVDLDALFARVDLDELIERVDINAVMDQVDVAEISERIRVWNIVAKSTGAAAGSAMDVARDQGADIEALVSRTFDRARRQNPRARFGPAPRDPERGEEAT
jgi:hypothetical protein